MLTRFSLTTWTTPLVLGVLVLGLGLRLVGVAPANWAALGAITACGHAHLAGRSSDPGSVPGVAMAQSSWFQMAQARCRADAIAADAAWQAVLNATPDRLDIVRAMLPQDTVLAHVAADRYPDNAAAQFWLADTRVAARDAGGAIMAYERGLSINATDANAWMALAELYEGQPDLPKAVAAYDKACQYVDHGKNGCPRAAQIHMQLHEYESAAARWADAVRQTGPDFLLGVRGQADAWLAAGQPASALPLLRSLARSGDEAARNKLADLGYSP